ncbi:hypothetical protein AHA02nite_20570 [Alkalibacillus haloalkaliphilus]|uniref:Uncharacterized protein n=1 Tax=Alkalibacillus haloalkaliphilus TaxID=94136 RepID=A0A511W6A2_9BACI|nr:hypothetical protein AHA02nite_20570 [Alkalibacillus haloalkaliphilus]
MGEKENTINNQISREYVGALSAFVIGLSAFTQIYRRSLYFISAHENLSAFAIFYQRSQEFISERHYIMLE